ncbi:uncharacterized protein A4U43_C08F12220 [Asparagus officinalis]|nr:uncharacterized protein A4U43_C08F12220 [Asparagus officinalis]
MGELATELGVGKRSKRLSARCRDPPVVVQASGLIRVSPPLEQHLPEEQSVIRVEELDRQHSPPSPKQRRPPNDEGESSEGVGEEPAAIVPLTEAGTEAPVMPEPFADADALDQEALAPVDADVLPPEALMDQEK